MPSVSGVRHVMLHLVGKHSLKKMNRIIVKTAITLLTIRNVAIVVK